MSIPTTTKVPLSAAAVKDNADDDQHNKTAYACREDIVNAKEHGATKAIIFQVLLKNKTYILFAHNGNKFADDSFLNKALVYNSESPSSTGFQGSGMKSSAFLFDQDHNQLPTIILASKLYNGGFAIRMIEHKTPSFEYNLGTPIKHCTVLTESQLKKWFGNEYDEYNVFYLKSAKTHKDGKRYISPAMMDHLSNITAGFDMTTLKIEALIRAGKSSESDTKQLSDQSNMNLSNWGSQDSRYIFKSRAEKEEALPIINRVVEKKRNSIHL